jgi:flagellar basal-body rod protein FlgB
MFVDDVINAGAAPSLEMTMAFAGQRQRIIMNNIANLSTPNFRQADVSPAGFQRMLAKAIDDRDARTGGMTGDLKWDETSEVRRSDSGDMTLRPSTPSGGVLTPDRNNRDLERLMQDHAENLGVFRMATDLLRSRMSFMRDVLAERV